jgi:signal transduction histidine kinase
MSILDMRTVVFLNVITFIICTMLIAQSWRQNNRRFAGMAFWVFNFALQTVALALIVLRGALPDWISSDGGKSVGISFQDNGIGMIAAQRDKIFEPFFTTKEVGKGTGLGMPISFGIIENHKGRITVESEKRRGTTMNVIPPAER